jgi:hypothetical protein
MNRSVGGSTANSAQIVQMMITAATANFGKESTPNRDIIQLSETILASMD